MSGDELPSASIMQLEEQPEEIEQIHDEHPTPTWDKVAARVAAAGRRTDCDKLCSDQILATESSSNNNSANVGTQPSPIVSLDTDNRIAGARLPTASYFGYSYTFAISLALMSSAFICLTIYSVYRSFKDPGENPYGLTTLPSFPLFSGRCSRLAWVSSGFHLIANMLGSVIFGISVYLQQLCTSPTACDIKNMVRQERGDIRFGSILPFGLFQRRQFKLLCVWILLLVTSLPIHLALNGALGYSYNAYQMTGRVVKSDNVDTLTKIELSWTNATGVDCLPFRSQFGLDTEVSNITLIVNGSGSTDIEDYILKPGREDTKYNGNVSFIQYCYENHTIPECTITVRYGPLLLLSSALTIKAAVALLALRSFTKFSQPLYNSLGDILDLAVRGTGITIPAGEYLFDSHGTRCVARPKRSPRGVAHVIARYRRIGWWQLMSAIDWLFYAFLLGSLCGLIMAVCDSTVIYFPIYSTKRMITVWLSAGFGTPFRLLWKLDGVGLNGEVNSSKLFLLVLIANLPQLWLSMAMLVITDHLTRIWLERDWRSYYLRPKRPRVSWDNESPRRFVRKPRFLQAAYAVTIFLLASGAIGHWITAESFFVVEMNARLNPDLPGFIIGSREYALIFYLTHSPGPMALGALLSSIFIFCMTVHLIVPQRTCMPVMNGSARVVLASCTKLTGFPASGIAWGDVSESNMERVAGFGGLVRPLSLGQEYPKPDPETATDCSQVVQNDGVISIDEKILYYKTGWRLQS